LKLYEIAQLCGASHSLSAALAETEPLGFAIDSRAIKPGELFIAIPGERMDGHQFVAEVLEKGACAALVVHKRLPFASSLGAYADRLLFVTDTMGALQQLAARVVAEWGRPVVGVTGSAGKTTIKDLTAHVLTAAGRVFKSLGNLNTGYGLPLTVGRMIAAGERPENYDFAVLEMGMNSYGEIRRLTEIAPPQVAVVGNVGVAHVEFFGSREAVAKAKAELVDGLKPGGTAVLNADDPLVIKMSERRADMSVLSFGIDAQADVRASEIASEGDLSGTRFMLRTPQGKATVKLPLIGRHNVYNALAASAVGHHFGLTAEAIARQLASAAPSKMRGELLRFANGVTVIDDSYNSNPQALIEAARAVSGAREFKRRVVVAGEMLELGAQGSALHRQCGREIAALSIDRLIGVRGLARELVAGAIEDGQMNAERAAFCETPEEAAEKLIAETRSGDLILVKGSRGVRTEKIIEKLRAAFGAASAERA
jgi:UDP-N-acetylmuramoyl-tripeptide--D-alanyl-D-alanine ligase